MKTPDDLNNRMVPPDTLRNRQAIQQPRPFDRNEPSSIADVPTAEDDAAAAETTREGEPGEHAEIPHPADAVVEGEDEDNEE